LVSWAVAALKSSGINADLMLVLVVGGGVAGVAASLAAAKAGASVTVIEGSGVLGLDQTTLPCALASDAAAEAVRMLDGRQLAREFGAEIRLKEKVLGIDTSALSVHTTQGRLDFERLVIATGSGIVPDELRGASKSGVFKLASTDDYLRLADMKRSLSHLCVMGPVPLSLMVADSLSVSSKTKVFLGARGLRPFSPMIAERIAAAATDRGVSLLHESVDSIVGLQGVEAVISSGVVHQCEGVVMLPSRVPAVPRGSFELGEHAGILVDRRMRTSSEYVFAAGDCTEQRLGSSSIRSTLHSAARLMGDVAGKNAAGGSVWVRLSACMELRLFGLPLCAAGIGIDEGLRAGLDLLCTQSHRQTKSQDSDMDVSLVFERSSRRIRGMQLAGADAHAYTALISQAISSGASLDDLAYGESAYLPKFNKDRSPIGLTALEALCRSEEPSLEAPGTHLRQNRAGRISSA
jgi:NADH oxidase (H2O2-forming)